MTDENIAVVEGAEGVSSQFIFDLPDLPDAHWGSVEIRRLRETGQLRHIVLKKLWSIRRGVDGLRGGVIEVPLIMQWDDIHVKALVLAPRREFDQDDDQPMGTRSYHDPHVAARSEDEVATALLDNMNNQGPRVIRDNRRYHFHVVVCTLLGNMTVNADTDLTELLTDIRLAVPLEDLEEHFSDLVDNLNAEAQRAGATLFSDTEWWPSVHPGRRALGYVDLPHSRSGCATGVEGTAITMPRAVWRALTYDTPHSLERILRCPDNDLLAAIDPMAYQEWVRPRAYLECKDDVLYYREQMFLTRFPRDTYLSPGVADDGAYALVFLCDGKALGADGGIWLPHSTVYSDISWMGIDVRNGLKKFMGKDRQFGIAPEFSLTGRGRISRAAAILQMLQNEQAFLRRLVLATLHEITPEDLELHLNKSSGTIRSAAYRLFAQDGRGVLSEAELDRRLATELNITNDEGDTATNSIFATLGQ